MNHIRLSLCASIAACGLFAAEHGHVAFAQDKTTPMQVEDTIRQYYAALDKRDAQGIQAVLDKKFVAIEAGGQNAGVYWNDAADAKKLLPPEGNNDFKGMEIADVKIAVWPPEKASVANVSFSLIMPLDPKSVEGMASLLKNPPEELTEVQRTFLEKAIKDKAVTQTMFAMLARRQNVWKIICMTFPK